MSRVRVGDQASELYIALVEVALAAGARDVGASPGCWEQQIDATWWMAANAAAEPRACSVGMQVPARAIYVERDGWPAGIVTLTGGRLLTGCEDALIAACQEAAARLGWSAP
jgi:hypothetical protein